MYSHEIKIRVSYADTDLMGFVYYGNYARYYENGRTEMMRSLGLTYREMEERGILMPVRSMQSEYLKPARYDQLLTLITTVNEMPAARITFYYELYNEEKELIHRAETVLIFLDREKQKPVRAPEYLSNKLKPYFET